MLEKEYKVLLHAEQKDITALKEGYYRLKECDIDLMTDLFQGLM